MKWFRQNIRTGSRLALFALALQFVLSFGHFHFNAAQAAPAAQALTDMVRAQGLAAGAATEKQQPPGHDDDHPSTEPCAICTAVSMANQMVFATPEALPLPDAVELLPLTPEADFAQLGSCWPAFQSRAPPVS
jgi:hypothetical protein